MDRIIDKFQEFVSYLIYEKNQLWIHLIIDILCEIEMYFKIMMDPIWHDTVLTCKTVRIHKGERIPTMYEYIPHNTLYCEDCPFRDKSKVASFFFGNQCNGYCYLLGRGDFSFINPTDLLWDGCKECGWYEDMEFVNEI
jgi:hypothetical protein